jgi:hypothetical protein
LIASSRAAPPPSLRGRRQMRQHMGSEMVAVTGLLDGVV